MRDDVKDDITDESFSMRTGGGRDVTLTLPDGRRTTFSYTMVQGSCSELQGSCYNAVWVAEPGITASLTTLSPSSGTDEGDNTLLTVMGLAPYWHSDGMVPAVENHDFAGFILKLEDGTQYRLDRENLGLHDIETEPGSYITVHAYGKLYVSSITLPDGS